MAKILVCDDHPDIVRAITLFLTADGHSCELAYNGREALQKLGEESFDLLLLDVMMPQLDGWQTLEQLRREQNLPVILLTALGEEKDKVRGLNLGADDYISKPFTAEELKARVRAQLRRYLRLGGQPKAGALVVGDLVLDPDKKQVTLGGQSLALTPIEYSLLKLLMQEPGKVFSAAELYERCWNSPALAGDPVVAVHIRHLREKIEINPSEPRYLKLVWGHGYRLDDPTKTAKREASSDN